MNESNPKITSSLQSWGAKVHTLHAIDTGSASSTVSSNANLKMRHPPPHLQTTQYHQHSKFNIFQIYQYETRITYLQIGARFNFLVLNSTSTSFFS